MKSFRNQDMKAEKVLGDFMDAAFYSKIRGNSGQDVQYKRFYSYNMQRQGVDVKIEVRGKNGIKEYLIDEKAALYYSNKRISTFAFEVNSIQSKSCSPLKGGC